MRNIKNGNVVLQDKLEQNKLTISNAFACMRYEFFVTIARSSRVNYASL